MRSSICNFLKMYLCKELTVLYMYNVTSIYCLSCTTKRTDATHLFDLVARAGDSLCDALVGADGRGEFSVVLDDQIVQITVTLLVCILQTALLSLAVLHIITAGQGPKHKIMHCEIMLQLVKGGFG